MIVVRLRTRDMPGLEMIVGGGGVNNKNWGVRSTSAKVRVI